MAASGIAKIVAAGGQAGIAKEDLLEFAQDAVKMGVAFDLTADQAGDMMAKWRSAFDLNQDGVVALADKINYLGNTTAASHWATRRNRRGRIRRNCCTWGYYDTNRNQI